MKNTILKLIAVLALCFMIGGVLVACKAEAGPKGDKGDKGDTGAAGATGATGATGAAGANGLTPEIKDGYWWIGETNTGVKAEGTDGAPAPVCEADHDNISNKVSVISEDLGQDKTYDVVLYVCDCGFAKLGIECGHGDSETINVVPNTCFADGYTEHKCNKCKAEWTDTPTYKTDAHAVAPGFAFNPDDPTANTANGWTPVENEDKTVCPCTVSTFYQHECMTDGCDEKVLVEIKPAALETLHPAFDATNPEANGWKKAENNVTAPCAAPTLYVHDVCSTCEAGCEQCKITATIPAVPHTYNIGAATCTEAQVCTECGHVGAEALRHSISNASTLVKVDPTVDAAGRVDIKCDTCHEVCNSFVLPQLTGDVEADKANGYVVTMGVAGNPCSKLVYTFTFKSTVAQGNSSIEYSVSFDVDGGAYDISHSEAPAESECIVVDKGDKRYYMYECEICGTYIIVKIEDLV